MKSLKNTYEKLINILQQSIRKNNNILNNDLEFKNQLAFFQSGVELLTNLALNKNPNGCFMIHRNFEGIEPEHSMAEHYIDLIEIGKVDEDKLEIQKKFCQHFQAHLKEENKHQFLISWDEKNISLFENWFKYNEEELNQNILDEMNISVKVVKYFKKFNSVIIEKLKSLIENYIDEEHSKNNEALLYNEITRHLFQYQLLSKEFFFCPESIKNRVKKLIENGKIASHHPIFIYGSLLTGKTLSLVNIGKIAFNHILPDKCLTVIKFYDLTSQSSTFEEFLTSVCEQLNALQLVKVKNDFKKKEITHLIELFFRMCSNIVSNQESHLLILIDGLKDFNIEKALIKKTNIANNQIYWLFSQLLPARVHMIVTITQVLNKVKFNNSISSLDSCLSTASSIDDSMIPLFLNYYHEYVHCDMQDCLIELPFEIKNKLEINEFFKTELTTNNRKLTYNQIDLIVKHAFNSKSLVNLKFSDSSSVELDYYFMYYIKLMMNEVCDKYGSLFYNSLFDEKNLPDDCESIITAKIGEELENLFFVLFLKLKKTFLFYRSH